MANLSFHDPECKARLERERDGIELNPLTWQEIVDAAGKVSVLL